MIAVEGEIVMIGMLRVGGRKCRNGSTPAACRHLWHKARTICAEV